MRTDVLKLAADLAHKGEPFVMAIVVRREPASSAQIGILKRKGIPSEFVEGCGLTKREASILMTIPQKRIRVLFGV